MPDCARMSASKSASYRFPCRSRVRRRTVPVVATRAVDTGAPTNVEALPETRTTSYCTRDPTAAPAGRSTRAATSTTSAPSVSRARRLTMVTCVGFSTPSAPRTAKGASDAPRRRVAGGTGRVARRRNVSCRPRTVSTRATHPPQPIAGLGMAGCPHQSPARDRACRCRTEGTAGTQR